MNIYFDDNTIILFFVFSIILLSYIIIYFNSIYYIFINYYVYIYIISSILFTILFLFAKCYMGLTYFDKYLYIDKNNDYSTLYYILFHVVYYLVLGLLFGFIGWKSSIIQTIIVEFLIAYVQKCDYLSINIETGIYSILIGLTSYFTGAIIRFYLGLLSSFYITS